MDNKQPNPTEQQLPQEQTNTITPPQTGEKKAFPKKLIFVAGGILVVLLIVMVITLMSSPAKQQSDKEKEQTAALSPTQSIESVATTPKAPNAQNPSQIMLYGAWTGQTSVIKAVDLGSSNSFLIATLPLEIKKVSVLSTQNLIYIDQLDTRDHGKRITVYSIKDRTANFSIPAANGYVIDEYVLSPDKKYLAIWEVQLNPTTQILQGGKSRVYAVDLSRPTVKNLLYDEQSSATQPIHYPRAILNDGTVFADTFMPNDPKGGAGWAYGMSVVDFDGTNKRDIETMKAGTYSTQPTLSPDGKYLLFAGYEGSLGDGNANKNGYRQALLTPNTVDLLNTQSLKRFTLPNLSKANTYSVADWEVQTGDVIITMLSKDPTQTGVYAYDLADRTATKITIPSPDNAAYGYVSRLNESKALIGLQETNSTNLGNLGENYAYPFTQIALLDLPTNKVSFVSLQDTYAQFITLLPSNYFQAVLGIKTIAKAVPQPTFVDMYSSQNDEKENLQLYTFFLKSDLATTRINQQSTPTTFKQNKNSPTCEQLAEQQCKEKDASMTAEVYEDCVKTNKNQNKVSAKSEGKCHDSPLYLYGEEGKLIRVKIQTPIYNTIPNSSGEYSITLGKNGTMFINNKAVKSIAYDYQSALRRIVAPTKGTIVAKAEVEGVLREYAKRLGLNNKETTDLINAGKRKITAPYAFVSFFNQQQSEQILPISFSPQPDNYLNVVFYFKLYDSKPAFTPLLPDFPQPIQRSGFTAVEVSEMVE